MWFTVSVNHAQLIRVIDHKGTPKDVDNSKWQLSGSDIYYKFGGKVGIGTNNPGAQLHTTGTIMFSGLGTNTTHTNIMTTDGSGNVSTRSLANMLNGNAMTSLNGLTNSVQIFSIGTAGTNIGITSSGSTHTFNIPTASATNRGALSSGDWTNFNNKEGAVLSGTTTQYYRGDKTWQTLNTTAVSEGTNLYFTNARSRSAVSLTTTGTSGAATYNATTGVLNIPNYADGGITSINGLTGLIQTFSTGTSGSDVGVTSSGSTHTFNIPTASATNRGALSSGDWTNFNNKIGLVTATTSAAVTTTGTDININNTASHWNANQLTGRNIASTAPADGQVLTLSLIHIWLQMHQGKISVLPAKAKEGVPIRIPFRSV